MTVNLVRKSQHSHVLVCRSCGEGCVRPDSISKENPSTLLKQAIEAALLNGERPAWNVRVVESGCLDVCPVGAVSVRLVGAETGEHKVLTWTVSPENDLKQLLEELRGHLKRVS